MPLKVTRSGNSLRGPRPKLECYDCGGWTGSGMVVFRTAPNVRVDWSTMERKGDFIHSKSTGEIVGSAYIVHRPGTGCHKNDGDVR